MIELKINGLKEITKMADKYPAVASKHITKAITDSLLRIEGQAKQNAPFGTTGNLRNNWKTKTKPFEGSLSSEANNAGFYYGTAVEFGTKPHYPNLLGIQRWAEKHQISPFAVARSIAKKGTKANPFFYKSVNSQEANIDKEFSNALEAIIKEI